MTELRTERSQTFLKDDGTFETIFHGTPVHYQDDGGAWQPIDNSLVPSSDPAHAARNKANRFVASLPAQLEHAPVRVAAGERSVDFSLQGAKGRPRLDKATATYDEALPGVGLVYTVTNSGLKEELVLAGPHAPASYEFALRLSPGLSATESASGIALVDEAGHTWARFSPPFVHDASYSTSGAATGFSNQAVSLRLEAGSPDPVLRLCKPAESGH